MKVVTMFFFMLMAALAISTADASSSSAGSANLPSREELLSFSSKEEANQMENKMMAVRALYNSTHNQTTAMVAANNSTSVNSSVLNSSSLNSSVLNQSAAAGKEENLKSGASAAFSGNGSGSAQGVGASSEATFNGFYGITASRHEVGKSDIKSSTTLRGDFQVDKSVSFSDRGF